MIYMPCLYSDTLFCEDFSLSTFINKFKQGPAEKEGGTLVSCYRCKEQGEAHDTYS